jgi:hypothetical protein
MPWFSKHKRRDPWEEETKWPIDDLEAARKIRSICTSAVSLAERVANQTGSEETKARNDEAERYKRATKTAMEIAIKMSDDLLRDGAVSQIVLLCVKANDLRKAELLFRAIQAVSLREYLLTEHPELRQLGE